MDNYANFSGTYGAHWHYHVVESLNSQNAGYNQSSIHLKATLANDSGYSMSSTGSWSLRLDGGQVASNSGTINQGSGGANNDILDVDVTVTHDANGNWSGNCGGSASFGYSGVGSASGDWGFSLPRIPLAPSISGLTVDTIAPTSARLGAECSSYGHGTGLNWTMYYQLVSGGSGWINAGTQGDVAGYNYWSITGLQSGQEYEYYVSAVNNNGDTANSGVQTFNTLTVPGMVPVLLGLI